MGWEFEIPAAGTNTPIDSDYRNVTNTPCVSVTRVADYGAGDLPCQAGIYRFTFASATTVICECIEADDQRNPLAFSVAVTVTCDDSTPNYNLLPGWGVVLSAAAAEDDVLEIGIGCLFDTNDRIWTRGTTLGRVIPQLTGRERLIYAHNDTTEVQCNTRLIATNAAWIENSESYSRPFYAVRQTGETNPTAHADLTGITISFGNLVPGTPNTVDILVDGSSISVYDVTNDTTIGAGTGLECDGTTVYRFSDGTDYQSIEFVLSSALEEADTATIYVSDGGSFIELSADGSDGWVAGTTGLYLTGIDLGEGVVDADESVSFWIRTSAGAGATVTLNQRAFSLRIASEGV
jgi:hypothetical protein